MENHIIGKVIRSSQRQFDCRLKDGTKVEATAKGKLLRDDYIVVGDHVVLSTIPETGEYQIDEIQERSSEIFRVSVREQKKKVTAANCDLLVILSSVSKPAFKAGVVDRFLVRACQWQVKPIVVFNKCDQLDEEDNPTDIQFESKRLDLLGVETYEISAIKKDEYSPKVLKNGWSEFHNSLEGRTALFLGQSGVGKSKTISALSGGKVDLKTHEVGKVGKGSHTTTWSELIELPTFDLIDSPGIRSFSLDDIDPREILSLFPDIEQISVQCKFNNCTHEENSKGCAFHKDSWSDEDKRAIFSRLDSYKRIVEEVSQTPFWSKKL
ncbi:MAG: ribosome small subunit-dependent GTPase A [Halobacteriovoraceae bacterium]|nr:ribosome small subunit-dependent GTPase A [Halobacteriovoraceae bacterium]